MTWTSPPTVATGDIYTAAMFNTYTRDNANHLRALTGGADPGAADKALYSNGGSTAIWGLLPSAAMAEQKVNQINPVYTTFAAALAKSSGMFTIENASGGVADGPVAGVVTWHLIQCRYVSLGVDHRVQQAFGIGPEYCYIRWVTAGTPSAWFKLWNTNNDGANSGLDADLLDGSNLGNANGNVPFNNGVLNTNLHADIFDGFNAGNGNAQIPINNGTLNTNLNADKLDGLDASNASGQVPINNGALNTNLNADMLDGLNSTDFARIVQGTYFGDGSNSRQIALGFIPKAVIITSETLPGLAVIHSSVTSSGVGFGSGTTISALTNNQLHGSDGFNVGGSVSGGFTNTSGQTYRYTAFRQ